MNYFKWRGNGNWGRWEEDKFGLPFYNFLAAKKKKNIAETTEPELILSPWHQIGNNRITATLHEDGFLLFRTSYLGIANGCFIS